LRIVDSLLAQFVERHLDEQFGLETKRSIKDRIFERYGISLTRAIKEYEPFDRTLREFFGKAADGMIAQLFEKICTVKKSGRTVSLEIKDKLFANLLLESYGNKEKKSILFAISSSALSISKILKQANMSSQTTGYRIINSMIEDGLIAESGFDVSSDGKKAQAYRSPVKKINIAIDQKSALSVTLELSDDLVSKSGVLNTIFAQTK
jgi:hypothetical protein